MSIPRNQKDCKALCESDVQREVYSYSFNDDLSEGRVILLSCKLCLRDARCKMHPLVRMVV